MCWPAGEEGDPETKQPEPEAFQDLGQVSLHLGLSCGEVQVFGHVHATGNDPHDIEVVYYLPPPLLLHAEPGHLEQGQEDCCEEAPDLEARSWGVNQQGGQAKEIGQHGQLAWVTRYTEKPVQAVPVEERLGAA